MSESEVLPVATVTTAVDARHWRVEGGALVGAFSCEDFATAARLVARVVEIAEGANHHPDVLLRWGAVRVTTISHDAGGLTRRDVDLARAVSAAADELGLAGDAGSARDGRPAGEPG